MNCEFSGGFTSEDDFCRDLESLDVTAVAGWYLHDPSRERLCLFEIPQERLVHVTDMLLDDFTHSVARTEQQTNNNSHPNRTVYK